MPEGLCAYITGLYLINSIPYTVVQTNNTDCTQQGVFLKNSSFYRELCVFFGLCCVCVCLPTMKHGNIVVEVALMELFALK